VELAAWVGPAPQPRRERPFSRGAQARGAVRLLAARVPEAGVHERRRNARKAARKRGEPPAQAQLPLLAWNLFIPQVPPTGGTPTTVGKA